MGRWSSSEVRRACGNPRTVPEPAQAEKGAPVVGRVSMPDSKAQCVGGAGKKGENQNAPAALAGISNINMNAWFLIYIHLEKDRDTHLHRFRNKYTC